MQGLFFVHISPDPKGPQGRMLIKTGVVKSAVGAERWLLEFQANGYSFSNVVPTAQLEAFAFFGAKNAQQSFIAELLAANTPAQQTGAVVPAGTITEEIPLIDSVL